MSPADFSSVPSSKADAASSVPLLRVRGLQKSFGNNRVLESVDLTVGRGRVLALIGPSGSGKTTILRCLNGLELPDGGTIEVAAAVSTHDIGPDNAGTGTAGMGTAPGRGPSSAVSAELDFTSKVSAKQLAALRDRSAMVFQHYNLFPHKTVLQNVIEGPVVVQHRPVAEVTTEALALLDRVGLSLKRDSYPFELSGGQQQRVGIVRALALRPQLLLFDEPTSALDPELVGDVLRLIKELADEGWSMVIVTHELEFAREVAHEISFVDGGTIVEHGDPKQMLKHPQQERTRQFLHRLLNPF